MINHHTAAAEVLFELERELRSLELWENQPPPAEALTSTQPFAVDTLRFPQWLQFIFMPRLYSLIEHRAALPTNCNTAPMAEEYFRPLTLNGDRLVERLRRIDELLSQSE